MDRRHEAGGSIIISASAGTASQINNAGVGVTTLNGGTLNFTTTAGTTTLPAGLPSEHRRF